MPTLASQRSALLGWVLVAMFATEFVLRGPVRTFERGVDLAAPYAGAVAFRTRQSPYDAIVLDRILLSAGRERASDGHAAATAAVYPPPTFLLLAPISALSWPAARLAFLVISLALFALHMGSLLRLSGRTASEPGGVFLIGAVLALAPYHSGISQSQLGIVSICLVVIGIERGLAGSVAAGGVALGLAAIAKPQIALPLVLGMLIAPRGRRSAAVGAGLFVAASIVAIGWLQLHDVAWWDALAANMRHELNGGDMDATGPLSAQMVDLRPLLAAFGVPAPATVAAAVVGGVLLTLARDVPRLATADELLLLSCAAVLLLLVGYHRFYDAAILCMPLSWAVRDSNRLRAPRLSNGVMACCAVFLVPGAWAIQTSNVGAVLPAALLDGVFWKGVVLAHQTWALLALVVILLVAARRGSGSGGTGRLATD